MGERSGSTTGGCFSQVAPWVPASAIQIVFEPPAGALSAPASAFARYETWRSVRRSSIEPWAVESPVWAAGAGFTSSTSAPAARTYVSTWFVSST